jgi:hypothetical protein
VDGLLNLLHASIGEATRIGLVELDGVEKALCERFIGVRKGHQKLGFVKCSLEL